MQLETEKYFFAFSPNIYNILLYETHFILFIYQG